MVSHDLSMTLSSQQNTDNDNTMIFSFMSMFSKFQNILLGVIICTIELAMTANIVDSDPLSPGETLNSLQAIIQTSN